MSSLDDYATKYKTARMERRNGVLQVTLHTEGQSLRWGLLPHSELPEAFHFTHLFATVLLRRFFRHLGTSAGLSLVLLASTDSQVFAQAIQPDQKALIEALRTARAAPVPPQIEKLLAPTNSGGLERFDLQTRDTRHTTSPDALSTSAATFSRLRDGNLGTRPFAAADLPPARPALDDAIAAAAPNRITFPYSFPWATVFKVLVRFTVNQQNVYYLCSAASLSSFHLLTAAQCLYNHDILGNGSNIAGFAQDVWAWPAQTDVVGPIGVPDFPYGVAKGTHIHYYAAWVQNSDFNWDVAWLALDRRIGDRIGWMGLETNTTAASLTFAGYPSEGQYGFANNAFQYSGSANVQTYAASRIYLGANVYGGEIGGPVWRYDGSTYHLQGVLSTSDRLGNAAATRITDTVASGIADTLDADQSVLAPEPRPYFIEYSLQGNVSKALLTPAVPAGGSLTVTYNLFNSGFVASPVTLFFYLSRTPQIDASSIVIGTVPQGSVAANSFLVQNATFTIPSTTPSGSYYVVWTWTSAIAEYPTHQVTYIWGSGGNPPTPVNDRQAAITDRLLTVSQEGALKSKTFTVLPCRVLDTRLSNPPAPIPANGTRSILVAGDLTGAGTVRQGGATTCGVSDFATAVYVNVVVVNPDGDGYLIVYPFNASPPLASTLNFSAGQTIANQVLVPICTPTAASCGFHLNVTMAGARADVVIDVSGYLSPTP